MSVQERMENLIDFMERTFPDVRYRITLGRLTGQWSLAVESVRNDKGPHTGQAILFVQVVGDDWESLVEALRTRCQERVDVWVCDGIDAVQKQIATLQQCREELERRIDAQTTLGKAVL